MSRYSKALGIEDGVAVTTALSLPGAANWAVSKTPALLGGALAQWAFEWAVARWPKHPRGADFVGSLGVVLSAYGMQVALTRFSVGSGHLVDKITDGMMGRVSPAVIRLLKSLWPDKDAGKGKGQATPAGTPAGGSASDYTSLPDRAQGLDGDREAIKDIGALLRDSPETTTQMTEEMIRRMRADGVDIDDKGRQSVAKSMREVSAAWANGQF